MHNGQVGGFDGFRKSVDMGISDALYPERKGATDSEAIFLTALGLGLDRDTLTALKQAVCKIQYQSEMFGHSPHMRLSAAFSDGERLYAVRYASDNKAPTLYYRYCEELSGYMVVSEPLAPEQTDWIEVPQGMVCCFQDGEVHQQSFLTDRTAVAA